MSSDGLLFTMYIQSQPLSHQWLLDLLYHLWTHGLHYNSIEPQVPTWNEELKQIDYHIAGGEGDHIQLAQAIERIVQHNAGLIQAWDKGVNLLLEFDTNPTHSADSSSAAYSRFGTISLFIHGSNLRTDEELPSLPNIRENAFLLAPYQQTIAAFIHWVEVLCNAIHPLFGISYDPIERRPSDEAPGILRKEDIVEGLSQNALPDPAHWEWLTYVDARFTSSDLFASLLGTCKYWLKLTTTKGLLAVAPLSDYRYETAEAHHQERLGIEAQSIIKQDFESAARYFERAVIIFRAAGNETEARASQAEKERMHTLVEMRNQKSFS